VKIRFGYSAGDVSNDIEVNGSAEELCGILASVQKIIDFLIEVEDECDEDTRLSHEGLDHKQVFFEQMMDLAGKKKPNFDEHKSGFAD